MKIYLVLCCVLALGTCMAPKWKREVVGGDFVQLVKDYGYPVESYDVQTEDGYILKLFRIPRGRQNQGQKSGMRDSTSSSENNAGSGDQRRVVYLMHGVMTNAECYVYGGPTEALSMRLADAGYDVYLGNARGTIYGQNHTTLDPNRDAAFWRFCWDDIGTKDLTALIDKAMSVSGASRVSYIGHNEGTTAFYVLTSGIPSYNDKFDRHISLGPIVYLKNADDEIIENVKDHLDSKSWIMKNLGVSAFTPTKELLQTAESNCKSNNFLEMLCSNMYFLFNGYNSKILNETTVKNVLPRIPSYASVREIVHYAQLRKSGSFRKYTEDGDGDEYDLSKVTVPTWLYYTPSDPMSNVEDVKYLANMLPNVNEQYNFEELTNNVDLLGSLKVDDVFNKVKQALEATPKLSQS